MNMQPFNSKFECPCCKAKTTHIITFSSLSCIHSRVYFDAYCIECGTEGYYWAKLVDWSKITPIDFVGLN